MSEHEIDPKRLRRWQGLTITLMCTGYAGYYLCRSNFSVCLPQIINYLVAHGMSSEQARIRLGTVSSLGVLAYAGGKLLLGGSADFLGGRRNFLGGMIGAVICTILFALGGGLPLFTLAWMGNRLLQSIGWAGMVKVTSKWFSYSTYGAVMGAISLSYLFGDAAARHFMSLLIGYGLDWRGVFGVAAGTLFVLFIVNVFLLKESRTEIGAAPPEVNPANLYRETNEASARAGLKQILAPLVASPAFWLVSALSLGCTLMRETFNTWTPTFFNQAVGFSPARSADLSALFPLFGGFSVILFGFLSDVLKQGGRAMIMFYGLLLTTAALLALALIHPAASQVLAVALVTLVGFVMLGPYSYLGGAIALDLGGSAGSATASGIIDGIGYLGGVLSGDMMARISVSYGWRGAFLVLAAVSAISSVASALFFLNQRRSVPLRAAAN
jgi:OPA family glycerol-3-phosphate transporter-like MFS transporter